MSTSLSQTRAILLLRQKHSHFAKSFSGSSHAVTLIAISSASSDKLRLLAENISVDIVVQLSGDIPKKLGGLLFPATTGYLPAESVERIRKLPGVIRTTGAVFCGTCLQINFSHFWEFTLKFLQESMV